MKKIKSSNLKVGITVVISIIILLYGIAFLKEFKFGVETNDLTAYFADVNGLKVGDQVSVNGVPKGKVKNIELAGDSVKVLFGLAKDVSLKKDYSVSIEMQELMSGKQLIIKPGKSSEPADVTKPLVGSSSMDIVSLIGTMNQVGEDVKDISEKLNKTTDDLHTVVMNINDIVGDEGFKSNLKGSATNFNNASRNLDLLLEENRRNLSALTSKLNALADNLESTVSDTKPDLKETISNVRTLTIKLDSLTDNFNQLVYNSKDTNSSVGKLLQTDEFYNNLNSTVVNIDKLVKQIKKEGIKLRLF